MSSTNTSSSAGVRNLRALFENKSSDLSTSPPSRGRSPSNSELSSSSRPVSKVRASFVAVEKPGESGQPPLLGLRKTSDVAKMEGVAEKQESPPAVTEPVAEEIKAESEMARPGEPTHARHARHITNTSVEGGLGSILKGSAFDESTTSRGAAPTTQDHRSVGKVESALETSDANGDHPGPEIPPGSMAPKAQKSTETQVLSHPRPTMIVTETSTRPSQAKSVAEVRNKVTPKSPASAKSPKTPVTPSTTVSSKPSPKPGPSAKVEATARIAETPNQKGQETKPQLAKKEPKATELNGNHAKMQRHKSPARPVGAPASVTAATAASSTRLSTSNTNGLGNKATQTSTVRNAPVDKKPATAAEERTAAVKRPPRASLASATSTQTKKAPRPSLPAHTNGGDVTKSRTSTAGKQPSEDFLARMMRPTASSAQKIHEKVQPKSPPRSKKDTVTKTRQRRSSTSIGTQTYEDQEDHDDEVAAEPVQETEEAPQEPEAQGTEVAQAAT